MDPATALVPVFYEYGPWAVVVVVVGGVLRVWRSGEFLPKTFVDQVLALKDERIKELQARYEASQDGIKAWRTNSEAALKAVEGAQQQQKQIMEGITTLNHDLASALSTVRGDLSTTKQEVMELRQDIDAALMAWEDMESQPRADRSREARTNRRPLGEGRGG